MENVLFITPEDARNILFYFHEEGGWEPGSFISALIFAIAHADAVNQAKLADHYTGLVQAYQLAANDMDGIQKLQKIAEK